MIGTAIACIVSSLFASCAALAAMALLSAKKFDDGYEAGYHDGEAGRIEEQARLEDQSDT